MKKRKASKIYVVFTLRDESLCVRRWKRREGKVVG